MMELVELIKDIGFPIAITIWLLWRENNTLKELIGAINDLRDMMKEIAIMLKMRNSGGDE